MYTPIDTDPLNLPPARLMAHGFRMTVTASDCYRERIGVFVKGIVDVQSTFSSAAPVVRTRFDCYASDLLRLAEWAEAHLDALEAAPVEEGATWLPLDLEMQVTLLDGDVWWDDGQRQGEFSLRVFVLVGRSSTGSRVYAGYEGTAPVPATLEFCAQLRAMVAACESAC